MSESATKSEADRVQEELNGIPIGSRKFTILGKTIEVPNAEGSGDHCSDGFGTWHPTKRECVGCGTHALCFCRKTDTPPKVVRIAKATQRRRKSTMSDSKSIDIALKRKNPFRVNSYDHIGRTLYLEIVRRGIETFTGEQATKLAANLKLKHKTDQPTQWDYHFHKYCAANYDGDKIPRGFGAFHGTLTFTGGNATNDKTFKLDVKAARAAVKKIDDEASVEQAKKEDTKAPPASTPESSAQPAQAS